MGSIGFFTNADLREEGASRELSHKNNQPSLLPYSFDMILQTAAVLFVDGGRQAVPARP